MSARRCRVCDARFEAATDAAEFTPSRCGRCTELASLRIARARLDRAKAWTPPDLRYEQALKRDYDS